MLLLDLAIFLLTLGLAMIVLAGAANEALECERRESNCESDMVENPPL